MSVPIYKWLPVFFKFYRSKNPGIDVFVGSGGKIIEVKPETSPFTNWEYEEIVDFSTS